MCLQAAKNKIGTGATHTLTDCIKWFYLHYANSLKCDWQMTFIFQLEICRYVTNDTLKGNRKICGFTPIVSHVDNLYFNRVGNRRVQVPVACLTRANGNSSTTCLIYDVRIDVTLTILTVPFCLSLWIKTSHHWKHKRHTVTIDLLSFIRVTFIVDFWLRTIACYVNNKWIHTISNWHSGHISVLVFMFGCYSIFLACTIPSKVFPIWRYRPQWHVSISVPLYKHICAWIAKLSDWINPCCY